MKLLKAGAQLRHIFRYEPDPDLDILPFFPPFSAGFAAPPAAGVVAAAVAAGAFPPFPPF